MSGIPPERKTHVNVNVISAYVRISQNTNTFFYKFVKTHDNKKNNLGKINLILIVNFVFLIFNP